MLLLPLVGVAEQDHLTQEGVYDHVLVVDLFAARGRKADIRQSKWGGGGGNERREKRKGNKQSQKRKVQDEIHKGLKLESKGE